MFSILQHDFEVALSENRITSGDRADFGFERNSRGPFGVPVKTERRRANRISKRKSMDSVSPYPANAPQTEPVSEAPLPNEGETKDARIRRVLDEAFRSDLLFAINGFFLVTLLLLFSQVAFEPNPQIVYVLLVSAGNLILWRLIIGLRSVGPSWAHPLGTIFFGIVGFLGVYYVQAIPGPIADEGIKFIAVAQGCLFLSLPWFILSLAMLVVSWGTLIFPTIPLFLRGDAMISIGVWCALSAIICWFRIRTLSSLESARLDESDQKSKAKDALESAQSELADRRKAEAALRASTIAYRAMTNLTGDIIVTTDMDGNFTYINEGARLFYGFDEGEVIGQSAVTFVHTADVDKAFAHFTDMINEGRQVRTVSFRAKTSRGWRNVEWNASALLDEDRVAIGVQAIGRDVTERDEADRALRESEARWKSLVDMAPDIVITVDPELRITYINRPEPPVTAGDLIGESVIRLATYEYQQIVRACLERVLATGTPSRFESPSPMPGHATAWFSTRVAALGDPDSPSGLILLNTDITESKNIAEELQTNEERFRASFDEAGVGIANISMDGRWLRVNREILNITGYSREELIHRTYDEMTHEDDRDRGRELYEKVMSGEIDSGSVEQRYVRKDGTEAWVNFTASLVSDLHYLVCVVEDITERRLAEQALRETKDRYQKLVDGSPVAIVVHDGTDILFANRMTAELLGADNLEQIVATPITKFIHPDSQQLAFDIIESAMSGQKTARAEFKFVRLDGELIDIELTAEGTTYNGKPAVQAVFSDITERVKAVAGLRKSEERYRLVAENASDVIWTTDMAMRFTFVSPAGTRMYGFDLSEAENVTLAQLLTPEALRIVSEAVQEEMRIEDDPNSSPQRTRTLELEMVRDDGETFWAEVKTTFLRDEEGVPTGIVGITREITDRKIAEAKNRKLEEQLAQSQKLEAIGTLAGGVAHDFNNLLTGILGYASMLRAGRRSESEITKAADVIYSAAERAQELTKQLLGFARRGKHQDVAVDLHETVEEVVALLKRTIAKNISIRLDFQAPSALIQGDPSQMQQVILNLAVNASDAMPDGGELSFATEIVDIDTVYCASHSEIVPGRYVMLSVTDTGTGIAKEIQSRVFEPFFTTKEQGKGTGMGLAMIYGIVKNHHGSIDLYSEVGHGSTFKILLPRAAEASVVAEGREFQPIEGTGKILVVDDEEVVREMATDMLAYLGYEVLTAVDGAEAVELYRACPGEIDLVIIDMIMPKMGGKECFEALREFDPDICAILSTGYSRDGEAQDILDAGMLGFVQKPYRIGQLSQVVSDILGSPGEATSSGDKD